MPEFMQAFQNYDKNLIRLLQHPLILDPLFAKERKTHANANDFTNTKDALGKE